ALHVAPALARSARRERLLSRVLEPVPLAALSPAPGADTAPGAPLGAVPSRQPAFRGGGAGRDPGRAGGRLVPRLPPRPGASVRARQAAGPLPRALLAHPVAAARHLPRRAPGGGSPRGAPRERSARVPGSLVRQSFPALRRGDPGRRRRLGDTDGDV